MVESGNYNPARSVWIDAIQNFLNHQPLPGESSHQKMAHALRKVEFSLPAENTKQSAILIILFEKNEEWNVILIQRNSGGPRDKHAGQIGFPGGKKDETDPDLMYTALREAQEEIGIDLAMVDVLGKLTPMYIPVSKFMVNPYVAYSRQNSGWKKQDAEIQSILEVPLQVFNDPNVLIETKIKIDDAITINHVPAFMVNEHIIWGATAMILRELLDILPIQK